MDIQITKLSEELINDGQPIRAIHNHLLEVFEEVNGLQFIDEYEKDKKRMTKEIFIESLREAVSVLEKSL